MAVAVQPTPEPKAPKQPQQQMGLVTASIVGAVFVLAAAALILNGIPWLWESGVDNAIKQASNSFVSNTLRVLIQVLSVIGLIYLGARLHGNRPATGSRGGMFFMIAVAFVVFFAGKALFGAATRGFNFGNILWMLVLVFILFLMFQFFRTGRFTQWSVALDQGGWFDVHTHKRTQGLKVRRLTILGILLLTGTGVWTLMMHNYLPGNATVKLPNNTEVSNRMGDWVVGGTKLEPVTVPPAAKAEATDEEKAAREAEREQARLENRARPRIEGGVTLLPDLNFTIPLVLIAVTLWFAWRAVNYPTFADFLIATEAEINKVSWSSRKALIRDTIVVLTSLILLTLFLFVVDIFWGFILSREIVGILPSAKEREEAVPKGTAEPVKEW
jgi:preprotein translocase SecE subunit